MIKRVENTRSFWEQVSQDFWAIFAFISTEEVHLPPDIPLDDTFIDEDTDHHHYGDCYDSHDHHGHHGDDYSDDYGHHYHGDYYPDDDCFHH